jgi:two-component system cell cycle response regulator
MRSLGTPRVVRAVLAAAAAWMALYELHLLASVPLIDPLFGRYAHDVVLLAAAGVCALRAVRHRPERLAWGLTAAALVCWTAGEIYFTAAYWTSSPVPVPSLADLGYLAVYPLAFAGLTLLLREQAARRSPTVWADGMIAALVVAALGAAVVFEAVLGTVGGRPAAIATNLAYPLGDLLLLGLVVTTFAMRDWRPDRRTALLGAGIVCFWLADSLYLVETAQAGADQESPFNVVGWGGFLLVAAAAWTPPAPMPRREDVGTIAKPVGFAIVGLGLLVYATVRPVNTVAVALATAALLGVIARLLITFRENVEMLRASRREALSDSLTGLGNRRHMMLDLERRFALGANVPASHLLLFDLDGFKAYNDNFGHPGGDALLQRVSARLNAIVRPHGHAYRMGGDEFAALVACDERDLSGLVREACAAFAEDGAGYSIETSVGAVAIPAEAGCLSDALRLADACLYEDKESRQRPGHGGHPPASPADRRRHRGDPPAGGRSRAVVGNGSR